jgi:uncharacterized protein YjbI with pentapeptide repeats/energy-coupling factor transporter ATP-binding protein EcfA2
MLAPQRALVRPRVISPVSGETLLLEDEIASLVERGETGLVWLMGGPGSGKTTALAHLAAVLPDSKRVSLHDGSSVPNEPRKLVVGCGDAGSVPKRALLVYQLFGWGDDEIIEYLLATTPSHCQSVVQRCNSSADKQFLLVNPELTCHLIDILAADENISTLNDALRRLVDIRVPAGEVRELAWQWCLAIIQGDANLGTLLRVPLEKVCDFPTLQRLLAHSPVVLMLAADRVANALRADEPCLFLAKALARELIHEAAMRIRDDQRALDKLKTIVAARKRELHAMAASLLHAARIGWRPEVAVVPGWRKLLPGQKHVTPLLAKAYLERASWPGIVLSRVDLTGADLSDSDLFNAVLDDSNAKGANLRGAKLTGASLLRFSADDAFLSRADLSYTRASESYYRDADLECACFEGALLKEASFRGAKLSRANFVRANLAEADLVTAEIDEADFSQAEFQGARLTGLVLRLAEFRQCSFRKAELLACDLEGMVLPGVDFSQANLTGALLTGTVMPRASFHGAKLVNTGLADVDWEQADLRSADLRGASFHMGSSRSGLVNSTIAGFGSRTGFYTDDYNEQDFKSPEEIRKANLRGADLRGAKIEGVDFYLVDLRDARYDATQERHFRSCGAILESRVT